MKKVYPNSEFTITGKNFYAGSDTAVYTGSIAEEYQLEMVSPPTSNEIKLKAPSFSGVNVIKAPLVISNLAGNYLTSNLYEFFPLPQVVSINNSSQVWEKQVVVNGAGLSRVTGVYLDDVQVTQFLPIGHKRIQFTIPRDTPPNSYDLRIETIDGSVSKKDGIHVLRPSIQASLVNYSNLNYGDTVNMVNGKSLDKVTTIVLDGFGQQVFVSDFTAIGSTGINFQVPIGTLNDSSVQIREQYGGSISQSYVLPYQLGVVSDHIDNFSPAAAKHGTSLTISGANIKNNDVLFKAAEQAGYVVGALTDSGDNSLTVTIPRGIAKGKITLSGSNGLTASEGNFYPLPVISYSQHVAFSMGDSIEIEAINATEARPCIGISGKNEGDIKAITNPLSASENSTFYGYTNFDHSSLVSNLPESLQTGVTKISAIVNSNFEGQGKMFLISEHEAGFVPSNLSGSLKGTITEQELQSLAYVSEIGVYKHFAEIIGVSPTLTARGGEITVSGRYFTTATGARLASSTLEEVKHLPKSSFEPAVDNTYDNKVSFLETGSSTILYKQIQSVKINTSLFNFTGDQGQLLIMPPQI